MSKGSVAGTFKPVGTRKKEKNGMPVQCERGNRRNRHPFRDGQVKIEGKGD